MFLQIEKSPIYSFFLRAIKIVCYFVIFFLTDMLLCWLGLMSVTAQQLDHLRTALRTLDLSSENQYKIRGQPRADKVPKTLTTYLEIILLYIYNVLLCYFLACFFVCLFLCLLSNIWVYSDWFNSFPVNSLCVCFVVI